MKNITKLDISKITRTGKYIDLDKNEIFTLSAEDILALRRFYNNPNIAIDFDFSKSMNAPAPTSKKPREQQPLPIERPPRKNYTLVRNRQNRYNRDFKYKDIPVIKYGSQMIIGGILVVVAAFTFIYITTNAAGKPGMDGPEPLPPDSSTAIVEPLPSSSFDDPFTYPSPTVEPSPEGVEPTPAVNEVYQRNIINKYCDIYHVNSEVVFNKIAELTNNFSSEDYLVNFHIPGVVCKGEEVYAESEEQLLVLAVRCIKQCPEFLNVSTANLYNNNGYTSPDDYYHEISQIAQTMGVDRCLVYAICRTECNFKSELFVNANNPAGLRNGDSWWRFDTKEEGFIEICAEIIKYYHKIGCPLNNISYETIKKIGDIHAPVSDGNAGWVDNVWSIYTQAKENEKEIFGDTGMSNKMN